MLKIEKVLKFSNVNGEWNILEMANHIAKWNEKCDCSSSIYKGIFDLIVFSQGHFGPFTARMSK